MVCVCLLGQGAVHILGPVEFQEEALVHLHLFLSPGIH